MTQIQCCNSQCKFILLAFHRNSEQVTDVHLSPEIVISCSQDATIRIWNIHKKEITRVIHNKLHIQVIVNE